MYYLLDSILPLWKIHCQHSDYINWIWFERLKLKTCIFANHSKAYTDIAVTIKHMCIPLLLSHRATTSPSSHSLFLPPTCMPSSFKHENSLKLSSYSFITYSTRKVCQSAWFTQHICLRSAVFILVFSKHLQPQFPQTPTDLYISWVYIRE